MARMIKARERVRSATIACWKGELTIVKTKSLDKEYSCVEAKQKCDSREEQGNAVC